MDVYRDVHVESLPGQILDPETSFHYNYHRYYDPRTGRYLTPDPIGLAGGINLFVYADNNPINRIDRLGLSTLGIDISATAGAGVGATGGYTYVIDSKLNIARISHAGGGGFGGAAAGGAIQLQWTNAPSVKELEGSSSSVGVSIGPGVQGTGEVIIGPHELYGANLGIAVGPGLPVELHGFVEHSTIDWQINLIDLLIDYIRDVSKALENDCE